ncbi:MAG: ABC transporter permease, partial [Spirochaetales bacterium]|nr:ABC transporter permease [Spirochaetales bacterium]
KTADGIGYTEHNDILQQVITGAGLNGLQQIYRTNLQKRGTVYFNGRGVMHKNIFGIDIENESAFFEGLDMAEGDAFSLRNAKNVLLSSSVAAKLGLRCGDDVLIKTPTVSGQINTGNFVVGGIINDNSIFGYFRCFMDRKELNRLVGLSENEYSSLGLINTTGKRNAALARRLYESAAKRLSLSDPILKKEDLSFEMGQQWKNLRYFVVSLDVFVTEVISILEVIGLVSWFLYAMLLLITLGSAIITIRLILNERRGEFGVMKAIGLYRKGQHAMLLIETLFLILFAVTAGFLLSLVIIKAVSLIPVKSIPGFDIFLKNGTLGGSLQPGRIFVSICVIFCIVLPPVSLNIRKILKEPCVSLLSGVRK